MNNYTGAEEFVSDKEMEADIRANLGKKEWNGCVNCADCCTMIGYSFTLGKEMAELYEAHFGEKNNKLEIKQKHVCSKLDPVTRKCTIYNTRPEVCRTHFCGASKKRAKVHRQIREEISNNEQPTQADSIDIFPYLSKIGGSGSIEN